MDPGEQTTGTRDEQYNLVSVLYHALQGAETIEAYTLDAEAAGDERLADFFREARATYEQLAERAKGMLGVLEVPRKPEVAPDAPPEGGISPGAMSGGIPPQAADVQRQPDVRKEGADVPTGEVSSRSDVPRASPGADPDESVVGGSRSMPPSDVQRGTSPERPSREAPPAGLAEEEIPGEPGRATSGRQTAGRPEEHEGEKKGLVEKAIDKAADKLTGR
jgi:hypothetical protein